MPRGRKPKEVSNVSVEEKQEEVVQKTTTEIDKVKQKKLEKLRALMNEKNREFKGEVFKFAINEEQPIRIPFGVPAIDEMIGGGLPSKRFNVIWGSKGTGKTTLAYMNMAQAQKMGRICAFIDLERSFDKDRAKQFGVNTDELVLCNEFISAESAMDILISMCKEKVIDYIVLDSIQGLSPQGEQETKKGKEKSIADDTMALLARKLSQFFRVSAGNVYKGDVCVVLIGQARMNLGGFIAFESLSGGHALMHWSTMIIQTLRGSKADAPKGEVQVGKEMEEKPIGFLSRIKLEKTKISSKIEGSEVQLPFYFDRGFDTKGEKK